uniref:Uncharacterized protein n=1 Tax=Knipowitschia caucasica TaxID=637954 RepID=A0AAV2L578_KNICA
MHLSSFGASTPPFLSPSPLTTECSLAPRLQDATSPLISPSPIPFPNLPLSSALSLLSLLRASTSLTAAPLSLSSSSVSISSSLSSLSSPLSSLPLSRARLLNSSPLPSSSLLGLNRSHLSPLLSSVNPLPSLSS